MMGITAKSQTRLNLGILPAVALGLISVSTAFAQAPPSSRPRYVPDAESLRQAYDRADRLGSRTADRVFKATIAPHWLPGENRFWYRNDNCDGTREFILVDAERGKRERAFDQDRLATALSKAAGNRYRGDRLPLEQIAFTREEKAILFRIGDADWQCDLDSYVCCNLKEARAAKPAGSPTAEDRERTETKPPATRLSRLFGDWSRQLNDARSPSRKWMALAKRSDFYVRAIDTGKEIRLTRNGTAQDAYQMLSWAPDSKTLVGCRVEPGERKLVHAIESSPPGGGRARLRSQVYVLPGDKYPSYELWLFEIPSGKATPVAAERIDFVTRGNGTPFDGPPAVRWNRDGRHFTYEKTDRGHQRFRVIEVNVTSGRTRNLLDEKSATFINGFSQFIHYTKNGDEILWASERDGWRHLYLIDARTGAVKHQITKGPWVVKEVQQVDEQKRQIWFHGCGKDNGRDPYLTHVYRVNFDGTGLVDLTPGNGTHQVQYSPDRTYLIDTYSRVDQPPIHELRRASDGRLMCELERADISALESLGWRPPEIFQAKARDGKTDIWGVVYRPSHLDVSKRYPVIEDIYAGPQGSFVPREFSPYSPRQALAELGFIVVQVDGMGTADRSKAFHDVCWRNLADAGFPDRILWIKDLARRYPCLDLERVGIYGTSAGGQSSTGALLFHPEFYKVAVSSCGCHDNRVDKASWNEQWMGYPVGPHYAAQSNITNAHRLRGKLLLIVGELDTNVPPESTLRLADALIKSSREFELLVIPGVGHTDGGAYGERRRRDFFVRHLLGVEPPDWNLLITPLAAEKKHADEQNGAHSENSDRAASLTFVNRSKQTVRAYWLDFGGQRVLYKTLKDGETYHAGTYLTHPWVITDEQDRAWGVYYPTAQPRTIAIESSPRK